MENKLFKNEKSAVGKYIAKAQPARDFFYNSRKNLIKSYVLDPDFRIVK